jgi:FkbM family methyltransferase
MWERAITGLASKLLLDDSGIIDVGANIGGVSHAFSQIVPRGSVVAIEANPGLKKVIRKRINRFKLSNVRVLNRAAYKKNFRILKLYTDQSTYASSSSLYRSEENQKQRRVLTVKLDSLRVKNLRLIKIDVEGAEVDVLLGAKEIINKLQPWIIFEVEIPIRSNEENPMLILDGYNYKFFNVNVLEEIQYDDLLDYPGVFNLLAVPGNKVFQVKKQALYPIGIQQILNLKKGDYLFDISLDGEPKCIQGIGIWNLDDESWEIYYETRLSSLSHSTNSCLPVYLNSDAALEIRFGLSCLHNHFVQAQLYSLEFEITRA